MAAQQTHLPHQSKEALGKMLSWSLTNSDFSVSHMWADSARSMPEEWSSTEAAQDQQIGGETAAHTGLFSCARLLQKHENCAKLLQNSLKGQNFDVTSLLPTGHLSSWCSLANAQVSEKESCETKQMIASKAWWALQLRLLRRPSRLGVAMWPLGEAADIFRALSALR